MRTITSPRGMQRLADTWRAAGDRVGVVPTMGALHAGHARLMRTARRECDRVILTLFVNPAQFAPTEDLGAYPRTLQADKALARSLGMDALFLPSAEAVYPPGFATTVHLEGPTAGWEGDSRPTHFDGVATVVAKLWNMTKPHRTYFGQKDAQQAAVVRRLAADLDFDVAVRVCPTAREPDGLACSSRNAYLTPAQRDQAACLYAALCAVRARVRAGERRAARLTRALRDAVAARAEARVDYAGIVCPDTMQAVRTLTPGRALAILAVVFGETRLLDNMIVKVPA